MKRGKYQWDRISGRRTIPLALVIALIAATVIVAVAVVLVMIKSSEPINSQPQDRGEISAAEDNPLFTPVGRLTLQQELAEACELEDTSKGSQYSMCFYGTVGTERVRLFELMIGENGTGYKLGSAPDASGKQTAIWLNIREIQKEAAWTAEEYARINELQSYVNDLIEQINHLDGFQGGV